MLTDKKVMGVGFQLIIRSGTVSRAVQDAVMKGLADVATQYTDRVKRNISLDDHSLKELRALGYPYRRGAPADTLHDDDRLVHEQSGELKRSIRKGRVEETTSRRFTVYVSSEDPKMPYLIYGTSRMRPRRFHEKAYEDIKSVYWKPLTDRLAKVNYRMTEYTRD